VLSLSKLPLAPVGRVYQAWLRHEGTWVSLGTAMPGADGKARIVAQGAALVAPAEALQVTLEPSPGSRAPSGPLVIAWPKP
jgi:anti-sigma-K factor RskA